MRLHHALLACALTCAAAEHTGLTSFWKKLGDDFGKRGASTDPDRLKATAHMQRRTLSDCEKAVELFEKALARSPDDCSLCLECANALSEHQPTRPPWCAPPAVPKRDDPTRLYVPQTR